MKKWIRYTILGLLYIILFAIGFTILENVESKKVIPFEHVQIGFFYSTYLGFLVFLFIYLPLTVITDLLARKRVLKYLSLFLQVILCSSVGVVVGSFMFSFISPEWVEIDGIILNRETSLNIFGVVGFLYSLMTMVRVVPGTTQNGTP
ncbi:hypothetical protein [Bacillus alkalicellulosilyticus]|uniref:hypothetical protein n=1 Tax=Alkalihalobacterium alkalicellulosilyticum TaxID=1912214 RepID=UPI0009982DDE|nr:hypothetical protein [Bacillus alkalicellulosilyticus]